MKKIKPLHDCPRLAVAVLALLALVILAGCTPHNLNELLALGQRAAPAAAPERLLDERVADRPMDVVELYLRHYQPGIEPALFQTTRVYDRNGALLAELSDEGRRTWVPLERISPHLIDATIATEDATFYQNTGIDPLRIAGAALQNMQEGEVVSGASTITMQLARNLFLPPEARFDQTVDRKTLEAALAQELTALYSKDELLEMYLNLLNYGQLAYGPEAAAQVYFGKSAADLTTGEATLLAGIPQQPANLNPYEDFEAARARQRVVLDLLARHEYLTVEEGDVIFAEEITLAGDPGALPVQAPHFVQYLIDTIDSQYGAGFTRRAGWNIYTTLDLSMQNLAQETVTAKVAQLRPTYDLSNAALVAMKPASGEILVMVGSADFADEAISGQVNVAVSPRQPGSAIKPVLYAAALDQEAISPATVIWDTPVEYEADAGGGETELYDPQNYDEKFHGPVTVRSALANSYNVPAVKLLDAFGVEEMLTQAQAMGIRSLTRGTDWYGLSLTLGGGELTLLDLTTAFHTLASDGRYLPAIPIRLIADNLGQRVDFELVTEPTQVVSPGTAFQVTDILSDNAARTPAFGANSPLVLSRPAAVKTGTTSDWRDNWTVGYTRNLVTGVWAGNSDGRPMRNASGVTGAAPIWNAFMEAVLADPAMLTTIGASVEPDAWEFSPPEGLEWRDECPPGVTCREGGERFTEEWLKQMNEAGPLGDSVVDRRAAPVYAQSGGGARLAGFCSMDGAIARTLLRLPGNLARSDSATSDLTAPPTPEPTLPANVISVPQARPADNDEDASAGLLSDEQAKAVAWALRYGSWADLGPCDALKPAVDQAAAADAGLAQAGLQVLVDVAAASRPDVAAGPSSGAMLLAQVSSGTTSAAYGTYALSQPVWHDAACPGQYIMGQILNREGGPVAGVRVQARDSWGNVFEAVSKSGAGDYGRFDFPIGSSTPQTISLIVVDANGYPISPTVMVEHQWGSGGSEPCHHVIFRGG
jgi:penicillin-binding protein 1C